MGFVVAGLMNKQIASKVNLCEITVKMHRAHVMRKMAARTLADLVKKSVSLGVNASPTRRSKSGEIGSAVPVSCRDPLCSSARLSQCSMASGSTGLSGTAGALFAQGVCSQAGRWKCRNEDGRPRIP